MEEAGQGHFLDLWCQIVHPHQQYIFSSQLQNVNLRLCFVFFFVLFFFIGHHRLKALCYFWDQQALLNVTAALRVLPKHYCQTDMRWMVKLEGFFCSFAIRVNQGLEENQVCQETGVLQEKAKLDQRYDP